MSEEIQPIGQVTHYFDRISVAVVHLWQPLAVGDWIHLYGTKTNFVQQVESMQIDNAPIAEGIPEQDIAVQVSGKVRNGDLIYPYVPE
jgi:hypothetical protein